MLLLGYKLVCQGLLLSRLHSHLLFLLLFRRKNVVGDCWRGEVLHGDCGALGAGCRADGALCLDCQCAAHETNPESLRSAKCQACAAAGECQTARHHVSRGFRLPLHVPLVHQGLQTKVMHARIPCLVRRGCAGSIRSNSAHQTTDCTQMPGNSKKEYNNGKPMLDCIIG